MTELNLRTLDLLAQDRKPCRACASTYNPGGCTACTFPRGVCRQCEGTGHFWRFFGGYDANQKCARCHGAQHCVTCKGTGLCAACGGKGWV